MDLIRAIRELHEELKKLNELIDALEEFQSTGTIPAPRRRGRRSMGEKERREVSQRMKRYWANRNEKD